MNKEIEGNKVRRSKKIELKKYNCRIFSIESCNQKNCLEKKEIKEMKRNKTFKNELKLLEEEKNIMNETIEEKTIKEKNINEIVKEIKKNRENQISEVLQIAKTISQEFLKEKINKVIKESVARTVLKKKIPSLKLNFDTNTSHPKMCPEKVFERMEFKQNRLQQSSYKIKCRSNSLLPNAHSFSRNNNTFEIICREKRKEKSKLIFGYNEKIFSEENNKRLYGQNSNSMFNRLFKKNSFFRLRKSFHENVESISKKPKRDLNDQSICKIKQMRPMTMEVRNLKSAQNNYNIKIMKQIKVSLGRQESMEKQKFINKTLELENVGPWKSFNKESDEEI